MWAESQKDIIITILRCIPPGGKVKISYLYLEYKYKIQFEKCIFLMKLYKIPKSIQNTHFANAYGLDTAQHWW